MKTSALGRAGSIAIIMSASLHSEGFGQPPKTLVDRLRAAVAESSLQAPGVKPWHLKMTVQLFDDKGSPQDHGTIQEWWAGPDEDRREYKTLGYSAIEIRKDGKLYRSQGSGSPPYHLELLRQQTVNPIPRTQEIDGSTPEMTVVNFGQVPLECIMLTQSFKQISVVPLGLFTTYCLDPQKNTLRAEYEFGSQLIVRNMFTEFQEKTVAHEIEVKEAKAEAATSQIVKIDNDVPDGTFSFDPQNMQSVQELVHAKADVMEGALISGTAPVFPATAKARKASGPVVLQAVIGTDGHIHDLKIASSPAPDLALSAIDAVRHWVYRPYLLKGVPTDVDTTITINFTYDQH